MRECPDCGGLYPDADFVCPEDGRPLVRPNEVDPWLGQRFGNYVLTRRLGQGGMGEVYLAIQPEIGSQVAIKVLSRRFASDAPVVDRFFNEARAVNLIGHENIVRIFDFARLPDGTPYFIMEYLAGHTLSALVGTPMTLTQAAPLVSQMIDGLEAAHEAGIVHRDLKPDNIFLVERRQDTQVKLLDFGIAKLSAAVPSAKKTESGVVMGSAPYLSPEQAAGETARVGPASDIYSLGVILYQLLTGQLPFQKASYAELLVAHMHEEPKPLRALIPELASQCEAMILRCLEKRPEARFTTMRALGEALDEVLAQNHPPSPKSAVHARHKASRQTVIGAGLSAVAALSIGTMAYRAHSAKPAPTVPAPPLVIAAAPPPPMTPLPLTVSAPAPAQEESTPPPTAPLRPKATGVKKAKPEKTKPGKLLGDGMIDVNF